MAHQSAGSMRVMCEDISSYSSPALPPFCKFQFDFLSSQGHQQDPQLFGGGTRGWALSLIRHLLRTRDTHSNKLLFQAPTAETPVAL